MSFFKWIKGPELRKSGFRSPNGLQVALGGQFEGPEGVQVALGGQQGVREARMSGTDGCTGAILEFPGSILELPGSILELPGCILKLPDNYGSEFICFSEYNAIKDQPGDSYFVRALFTRLPDHNDLQQLSFTKVCFSIYYRTYSPSSFIQLHFF